MANNFDIPKLAAKALPFSTSLSKPQTSVPVTDSTSTPVGSYSPYHGITSSNNPFESPFHLIGSSPFHVVTTESPYHVPSSTESPMHAPDESPMYIPASLSECVHVPSLSEKEFERTQKVPGESKPHLTQKRKLRNKESAKVSRKRRVVSGTAGTSSRNQQAKVACKTKRNSMSVETSIKGAAAGKASESDNCDSDNDYDTSDMENGECTKRRRFCIEQMDGLASHFHKFQEKFYNDKLCRLETNILKLKSGKCDQYLTRVGKETERLKSKKEHLAILNKYRQHSVKNTYQYHEFITSQELQNDLQCFRLKVKSDLTERKKVLEKLNCVGSSWDAKDWKSFKIILNEIYPTMKPPIVIRNGPVVVYQLSKNEIDRDLAKIRSLTGTDARNGSSSTSCGNNSKMRHHKSNKKAGRKKYSSPKTVIFNNLTIKTSQRLCVEHPGSRNFYGYASEVDKTGALVIRGQPEQGQGSAGANSSSSNVRVVTVQQIKNGEIYLHAA